MGYLALSVVMAVVAVLQALGSTPARIGDFARRISDPTVAELERAIEAAVGKPWKPWLLMGGRGPEGNSVVHAYLPEESPTAEIRRSRKVILTRPSDAVPWTVEFIDPQRSGYYAQVAIPGRSLDEITEDRDINQPFGVVGRFQDAELIAIVRLIRSNPPLSRFERLPGDWPIAQISRTANGSVNVSLRGANGYSGISASLTGEAENWEITRTWNWVD
jgi:hypothetical protein